MADQSTPTVPAAHRELYQHCEALRRDIKRVADLVQAIRMHPDLHDSTMPREAGANITLAYRHLEDASMRLGKALQALDDGTSVYDRSQVPGA